MTLGTLNCQDSAGRRPVKIRKSASNYVFNTLVENNLAYGNGGKGIHIFLSDNVTVRNNAAHWNNRDELNPATWRGELSNCPWEQQHLGEQYWYSQSSYKWLKHCNR